MQQWQVEWDEFNHQANEPRQRAQVGKRRPGLKHGVTEAEARPFGRRVGGWV